MPDQADIEIVAEQVLADHARPILVVEAAREAVLKFAFRILVIAATDHMGPQCKPFIGNIAIERVEIAM